MAEFPNKNNGDNLEIRIRGRIVDKPTDIDGKKYVSVKLADATNRQIIVTGIRLEDSILGIINPIGQGRLVDVSFPSRADFIKLNGGNAKAALSTDVPNTENQAVPANLLGKIDQNSLSKGNNNVCLTMRSKAADIALLKRKLSEREQLSFIQHPYSKNSPGLVIDKSNDGSITQFDTNGNIVKVGQNGLVQDVSMVNSESAVRGKRSLLLGGMAGIKTDTITEMVPGSNIFTPVPTIIPDITLIVYGMGIIRMIMAVSKLAKEGLQELRQMEKKLKEEDAKEKLKENFKITAFLLEQQEEERFNNALKTNPNSKREDFRTAELKAIKEKLNMAETEKISIEDVGKFGFKPNSDESNVSRAQKLQILKTLNKMLEQDQTVDPAMLKTIDSFIQTEKKERENVQKEKGARSRAFDKIVNDSSVKFKNTATNYSTEGTKEEESLDKFSFLQETNSNKAPLDRNAFSPKKPFKGD